MTNPDLVKKLSDTIHQIAQPGKGILAADESVATATKRLESVGVASTEENRRRYREMLFSTPGLGEYISGVILFDETLRQKDAKKTPFAEALKHQHILSGIKVDSGLINLDNTDEEKVTQGLDNLANRLQEYAALGACFAKWRNVYTISKTTPSERANIINAHNLARYAAICQNNGFVPIVEPEVLIDGDHNIQTSALKTTTVLKAVFEALKLHGVDLKYMILKPSMVISGKSASPRADIDTVAKETLSVLKETVPKEVPSINFLSGGQTPEESTAHLNRMHQLAGSTLPWNLSFSYGRALQDPALKAWAGKEENVEKAQRALFKRAKLNGLAAQGRYDPAMENSENTDFA
ncbi:MAG: fda [Gammaproteobacteria bacterium]|nr:fda [Gammaproteobacteria bacterium]